MQKKKNLAVSAFFWTLAALIFTVLVMTVDVRAVGPNDSYVGFATVNAAVSGNIGVHLLWYEASEVLGYLSLAVAACFALTGLTQLIRGRGLKAVDRELLALGGLYLVTIALYVLFDKLALNYRPVLENGVLEPSYPSSHTMLAIVVYGSAIPMIRRLSMGDKAKRLLTGLAVALLVATPLSRLLSGFHWLTDIIGAILIAVALIQWFRTACAALARRKKTHRRQMR